MISLVQFYITSNHKNHSYEYRKNRIYSRMERIMERFDLLKEQMIKNQSRFIEVDGEQLLDNKDVLQLLKI